MTNFEEILKQLVSKEINFVLIGGLAAVTHGSAYETSDLDICHERTKENIQKLAALLKELKSTLRGVDKNIPFIPDQKSITNGMNFTFETTLGNLDILGEVEGLGNYHQVKKFSEPLDIYGMKINILSIEGLIRSKKAAGRPKDQMHLQELQAIQEMKKKGLL